MTVNEHRVQRVARAMRMSGCTTCQEWQRLGKIETMTARDNEVGPLPPIPERCPTCGARISRAVRRIVVSLDAS